MHTLSCINYCVCPVYVYFDRIYSVDGFISSMRLLYSEFGGNRTGGIFLRICTLKYFLREERLDVQAFLFLLIINVTMDKYYFDNVSTHL